MRRHLDIEVKVGFFVAAGIALILGAILVLGGDSFTTSKSTIPPIFPQLRV